MKDFFDKEMKYINSDIDKNIECINEKVINYSVKKIISEINSYKKYIDDSNNRYVFLSRPLNTSVYGLKNINK